MNEQDADLSITMAIARGASPSKEQLAACSAAMAKKLLVENTIFFQVPKRDEPSRSMLGWQSIVEQMRHDYPSHAVNVEACFSEFDPADPAPTMKRLVSLRNMMLDADAPRVAGYYTEAISYLEGYSPAVRLAESAYLPGALVPVKLDDFRGVPYARVEVVDAQRGRATVECGDPDCTRARTVALPLGTLDLGWEWSGGKFWCPDHGAHANPKEEAARILGERVAGVTHAPGDPPKRVTFHLHEPASFVEMDVAPPSAPAPYVARCDVAGCTTEEPTNLPGEELPAGWGRGGAIGPGALLCPRHAAERVMVWVFCVICGEKVTTPEGVDALPSGWVNYGIGIRCPACSRAPLVHHLKSQGETTCGRSLNEPSPDEDEGRDADGTKWTRFSSRVTCSGCRVELGFESPRTEPLAKIVDHRMTILAVQAAFMERHLWIEADLTDAVKRSRAHTRDALEDLAQIGEIEVVDDDGPTIWGRVVKVHLDEAVKPAEPGCRVHGQVIHFTCSACMGAEEVESDPIDDAFRMAAFCLAIERYLRSFGCPLTGDVIEHGVRVLLHPYGDTVSDGVGAALEKMRTRGEIRALDGDRWELVTKPRRFESRASLRDALKLALGGKIRMVLLDDAPTWETVAPTPIEKEAQRLRLLRDACNWLLDRIGGAK